MAVDSPKRRKKGKGKREHVAARPSGSVLSTPTRPSAALERAELEGVQPNSGEQDTAALDTAALDTVGLDTADLNTVAPAVADAPRPRPPLPAPLESGVQGARRRPRPGQPLTRAKVSPLGWPSLLLHPLGAGSAAASQPQANPAPAAERPSPTTGSAQTTGLAEPVPAGMVSDEIRPDGLVPEGPPEAESVPAERPAKYTVLVRRDWHSPAPWLLPRPARFGRPPVAAFIAPDAVPAPDTGPAPDTATENKTQTAAHQTTAHQTPPEAPTANTQGRGEPNDQAPPAKRAIIIPSPNFNPTPSVVIPETPARASAARPGLGSPVWPGPVWPNIGWPGKSGRTAATTQAAPLSAIDVFRGLTILEVVSHHATGMALRYTNPASAEHLYFLLLNRTFHFAVPAFVFLSAVVLTRSLLRNFDPGRYFWRRLIRGGWPYLLWSALYMWWYVWTDQRPPETLTDPAKWQFYLLYGKASYHLYFLLVALQVYLILPLLLPIARRKPSISVVLVGGLAVQIGLYYLNREVLRLPYPASTVLWYVLPIVLGMSVGARLGEFQTWWRKRRLVLLPTLLLSYALYLPLALAYVRGEQVPAVLYTTFSWMFTSLMALTLLGLAYFLQRQQHVARTVIATLGTVSLQVYLIHPAILQTLETWYAPTGPAWLMILIITGYLLIALALPAALALLLPSRISKLIFGR